MDATSVTPYIPFRLVFLRAPFDPLTAPSAFCESGCHGDAKIRASSMGHLHVSVAVPDYSIGKQG